MARTLFDRNLLGRFFVHISCTGAGWTDKAKPIRFQVSMQRSGDRTGLFAVVGRLFIGVGFR